MYDTIIAQFKNTKGWLKDINCNIGVKEGFLLSPIIFNIYIDKLEVFLEEACCVEIILAGIVIILLLYDDDIVRYATKSWK